jgi:hypothetical protein
MLVVLEKITRAVFVVGLLASGYLYPVKDSLPAALVLFFVTPFQGLRE